MIKDRVFQVTGIGWEWGMIAATVLIFFGYLELYKAIRRLYIRRSIKKADVENFNEKEIRLAPTMEPKTI